MARLQVQGIEAPQLQSQSVGRVQVNTVAPQSNANKLLSALASGGSAVAKGFAKYKEGQDAEDTTAADSFSNSLTLEQITERVKNGDMPADSSPVFKARVEHNYGANYLSQMTRDAQEKAANGEFTQEGRNSSDVFEEYLTNSRNEFLKGASKYTVAGFDKDYNATKEKLQNIISTQATSENIIAAQGSVAESLIGTLEGFKGADAFGVSKLGSGAIPAMIAAYKTQTKQLTLPPNIRKGVLAMMANELVNSGDEEGLAEFMATELDNGVSVRSVVSGKNPAAHRLLTSQAKEKNRAKNREQAEFYHDRYTQQAETGDLDVTGFAEARKRFEPYADFSSIVTMNQSRQNAMAKEADKLERTQAYTNSVNSFQDVVSGDVALTIATGEVPNRPDRVVTKPSGSSETLSYEDTVVAGIESKAEGNPELKARLYSAYGFTDEASKRTFNQLASGIYNSVNKDGVLPASVIQQYESFKMYNGTNPAYTKKLMGENYDILRDFDISVRSGVSPEQAASTLRLIAQSSLEGGDISNKKLLTAVDVKMADITDRSWFSNALVRFGNNPNERDLFLGDDAQYGVGEISSAVKRNAKGLLLSGQSRDPAAAIDAAYNTMLSTGAVKKANGQLYWASDLPQKIPEGMTPVEGMEVYRSAVRATLQSYELEVDEENIMLLPNRNGSFTVKVRGSDGSLTIPRLRGKVFEPTLAMVEGYLEKRQDGIDRRKGAKSILDDQAKERSAKLSADIGARTMKRDKIN